MNKELILKALNAYKSHKKGNLKNALKYQRMNLFDKILLEIIEIEKEIVIVERKA